MRRLKRAFGPLFFLGNLGFFLHSSYEAALGNADPAFWGAVLATLPGVVLFVRLVILQQLSHTSRALPSLLLGGIAGTLIALVLAEDSVLPWAYAAGAGLLGGQLYTWWYSALGRPTLAVLRVGDPLPDFELEDHRGNPLSTLALRGRYILLMFYRGNWCPLCTTQVQELAAAYRSLEARGVEVVCISPQVLYGPAATSAALGRGGADGAGVVHFATHAVVPTLAPEEFFCSRGRGR